MLTPSSTAELRRGTRHRPEVRRNAILKASLIEFAREGLAGARMDAIAEAAGVNKALLYYYFGDKDTLYGAILDRFFEKLAGRIIAVCDRPGSAGERFLSYALTHFDSIAESPYHAPIFMSELMSAGRGGSPHLDRIFAKYMQPIGARMLRLIQEGVRSGEFRALDPNQFAPSAIGVIVHFFLTAPVRKKFAPGLDFSSPKFIDERRAAVLDFIAASLFADREAGLKLAAEIAATPSEVRRPAPRKRREKPPATASPKPFARAELAGPSAGPGPGYIYGNRWFPDAETADAVLQAEREGKRARRKSKSRRAKQPLGLRTPYEGGKA